MTESSVARSLHVLPARDAEAMQPIDVIKYTDRFGVDSGKISKYPIPEGPALVNLRGVQEVNYRDQPCSDLACGRAGYL